jgi:uncharacterized protein (TIGR02271 family)
MRTVIGLFDDHDEAMSAYTALQDVGFAGADLDILTDDDRNDEPKLARIRQYVPEPDSTIYLEGVRQGGTLITAKVQEDQVARAAEIMSGYNMVNIQNRSADWRTANTDLPELSTVANNRNVLEVIEEDMEVGKEEVERGRMRVYNVVTEQPVERDVNLREESIRVQRRPVDRTVPADPSLFQERSVEVVERGEVANVDKVARVVEEVVVGKEVTERTETIKDTLRRQDVEVERVGGRRDFADYETDFRSYYNNNWANSGMTYEQYSPGLRFGYQLANTDAYRDRSWSEVEADARRSWEEKNPGTWDRFKAAVQHAWDTARGAR